MADPPEPRTAGAASPDARKHAPATQRNREPILGVLRGVLPASGTVLEIASGSGEHAVCFARAFPGLAWQPSDPDPACRASIAAWAQQADLPNLSPPIDLDAETADFPPADAIVCINMVHISPWRATLGLLAGAGRALAEGAPLYLYGPFARPGETLAPSNAQFDASLRARNPEWGIRDVRDIESAAHEQGLAVADIVSMPANNLSVVLRKDAVYTR